MACVWRYLYNCLLLMILTAVGISELPDCCGQGTTIRMELDCFGDSGRFLVQIKTAHFQGSFIKLTTLFKTDVSKLQQLEHKYEVILQVNESKEVTAYTPYFHDRGLYQPEIELIDCEEDVFQMCAEHYMQGSSMEMNCTIPESTEVEMNPYLLSGLCIGFACILTLFLFIMWKKRTFKLGKTRYLKSLFKDPTVCCCNQHSGCCKQVAIHTSKLSKWCKVVSISNSSPAVTLNDMVRYDSVSLVYQWTADKSMEDLKGKHLSEKEQLRKLYILLYNPDDPDHSEAVDILVSLFSLVGLEAVGHEKYHKFTQWLDVAEMALSNKVSDFVVIISKQLQSLCHQYLTHESEDAFEKLLTERNMEYFPCVVLKHLRHRYLSPYLPSFRVHIMSLGYTNSDVIREFINDHKSFMKCDNYCMRSYLKNTYVYNILCAANEKASKPIINNMTESMMSCIQGIYRSWRLGDAQREILANFLASPDGKKFDSIIRRKTARDT